MRFVFAVLLVTVACFAAPADTYAPLRPRPEGAVAAPRASAFDDEGAFYTGVRHEEGDPLPYAKIGKPVVYENGVLFTCEGGTNDDVRISGSFLQWTNAVLMNRGKPGVRWVFLPLEVPRGRYAYRYQINGVWINDPFQKVREDDGYGNVLSVLDLKRDLFRHDESPKDLGEGRWLFFLRDEGFRRVSFVGSVNRWDPYVNPMTLSNGYWTITLRPASNQYLYRYAVDGRERLDPRNRRDAAMPHGERVSVMPTAPKKPLAAAKAE